MKKIIMLLVAAILFSSILAGCFGVESSAPDTENSTTGVSDTDSGSASDTSTGAEGTGTGDDSDTAPESGSGSAEVKTDTGRYVGQIDANSIEIKISGVPDEIAARAFRLNEEIKGKFESFGLKKDDVVKVEYTVNEYGQLMLQSIEKLVNVE